MPGRPARKWKKVRGKNSENFCRCFFTFVLWSSLINRLSWWMKLPNLGFNHIVVPNKSLAACRCCRGHNHDWIGPALKWIGSKWSVGQPDSTRLPLFHFQSERSLQQFPCSALNGWPWPQCKVLRKFENFFASPRDEAKMRTPQVKCPILQCQIVAWTFCCRQEKFLKHVDLKQ